MHSKEFQRHAGPTEPTCWPAPDHGLADSIPTSEHRCAPAFAGGLDPLCAHSTLQCVQHVPREALRQDLRARRAVTRRHLSEWDLGQATCQPFSQARACLANDGIKVKRLKRHLSGEERAGTRTQGPSGSGKRPSLYLYLHQALNVTPAVAGWSPGLQSLTPGRFESCLRSSCGILLRQPRSLRLRNGGGHKRTCVTRPLPGVPRGRSQVLGHRIPRLWRLGYLENGVE